MTLQFGIISRTQEEWCDAIGFAGEAGFDHVELRLDALNHNSLVRSSGFIELVRRLAEEKAVTLSLHGMDDVDCNAKVPQVRAAISQILQEQRHISERLRARWLVIHTGRGHCENTLARKAKKIVRCAQMLAEVFSHTRDISVPLAIENLPRMPADYGRCYFGDCVAELNAIAAQVASERLRFVWDFGHAKVGARDDWRSNELAAAIAHEKLIAFHLHTNDYSADQHRGFGEEHMPADASDLSTLLAAANSGLPLVLEVEREEAVASRELLKTMSQAHEQEPA